MMDSMPIAQFIEATYPEPPLLLSSELGSEIEAKARAAVGPLFRSSLMPREIHILSPRSQEYFRRTREAMLGHRLEDLLSEEKEEQGWKAVSEDAHAAGELMLTHRADGPFVLGAQPSYTDFFIAGSLQCARVIDEGVFQRNLAFPGYGEIYHACLQYMAKRD
jgi:glutathione S-transferase